MSPEARWVRTRSTAAGTLSVQQKYPRGISLVRPAGNYELQITIQKLTLDEPIAAAHFALEQPQGTKLVREGEDSGTTEETPAGAAGAKEPQP